MNLDSQRKSLYLRIVFMIVGDDSTTGISQRKNHISRKSNVKVKKIGKEKILCKVNNF